MRKIKKTLTITMRGKTERRLGKEMSPGKAIRYKTYLHFFMVSTTWVLGLVFAVFTVVNLPVPAFLPILDDLLILHHLLSVAVAHHLGVPMKVGERISRHPSLSYCLEFKIQSH
jgi:hypothetical protein